MNMNKTFIDELNKLIAEVDLQLYEVNESIAYDSIDEEEQDDLSDDSDYFSIQLEILLLVKEKYEKYN